MDTGVLVFLLLFVALFGITVVDFSRPPSEDAAILMRYADHFAHGHGIVWNIGDKPVDGATDFLFMVVLALFVRLGLTLEFACRMIGFVSHVLTIWIVYLTARRLYDTRPLPALIATLYLAVGPGLYYVAASFGTPFFVLLACTTWVAALTMIMAGEPPRVAAPLFAASALVTSLIRPEGVILTGLMLLAVVCVKGLRTARLAVLWWFGTFLLAGGAYFLWRWSYFGYPLPNPYYVKGGLHGNLHFGSLKDSVLNSVKLCLPFLPLHVTGLFFTRMRRLSISMSIPPSGFALAFVLISDEMNYAARFQYVVLPLVLMSLWPLATGIKEHLRLPKWGDVGHAKRMAVTLLATTLSLGMIVYGQITSRAAYSRDGKYDMAVMLSEYSSKGFTMATTEAGLLPLYSRWRAIDTYGLNDPWIAHHGGVTAQYLDLSRPHVVMFHAYFSPHVVPSGAGKWFTMTETLHEYAENSGYVLAAAFGASPHNTHYYYVRSDFPESAEIIARIRSMDYVWDGAKATDYAMPEPGRE